MGLPPLRYIHAHHLLTNSTILNHSLQELLTRHKTLSAEFLEKNYDQVGIFPIARACAYAAAGF